MSRIQVVRAGDEHAVMLATFFREVWGSTANPDDVLAARRREAQSNAIEPGITPPSVIAHDGERILAYVGSLPMLVWTPRGELHAYWAKGWMVLPEQRNGPLGAAVMKELLRCHPRSAALIGAPIALRLLQALGFRDGGGLSNHILILDGWRVAQRVDLDLVDSVPATVRRLVRALRSVGLAGPLGAVAALALRAQRATGWITETGRSLTRFAGSPSAEEIDALWIRARSSLGCVVARDGRSWRGRYGPDNEGNPRPYSLTCVRRRGVLVGVAAVRQPQQQTDPRLKGLRVAVISDALFDAADHVVAKALVRSAVDLARRSGADAVLCSTSAPAAVRALGAFIFVPLGANLRFVWRGNSSDAPPVPPEAQYWWLFRGDGESDSVF